MIVKYINHHTGFEVTFDATDGVDLGAWDWTRKANCLGADTEVFFATDIGYESARPYLTHLCDPCPVRAECLEHAIDADEKGWWGGTTREDRRRIKRWREHSRTASTPTAAPAATPATRTPAPPPPTTECAPPAGADGPGNS